jgi:hypothetical protein
MQAQAMPQGTKIIEQDGEKMLTPADIAPTRAPAKASSAPVKKSPQARRPYYNNTRMHR